MAQQYPALFQFLGGYFHEDWQLDFADWISVVRDYKSHASSNELRRVIIEIEGLLIDTPDDQALRHRLFHELGCYYDPRPDLGGPSYHEWLASVADHLRPATVQYR